MGDTRDKTVVTDPRTASMKEHHGKSGGNMGAGQSGKENLGTEKPADDNRMGSQKANPDKKSDHSDDKEA